MDSNEVRREWAERTGEYSPEYYAYYGPNETSELLQETLGRIVDTDAAVLELGCSSGRHLKHLHDHGYGDLHGVDINDDAFDVMAEHYPRLAEGGSFRTGALEELLPEYPDDAVDVVYSVETLQHVHPDDEWVFDELVRVTGDLLVTAENEGNSPQRGRGEVDVSRVEGEFPLYHRNWKDVFTDRGLAQLLREPTDRDTVRVFRVP